METALLMGAVAMMVGRVTVVKSVIQVHAEMETALSMDANAIFTGRTPLAPNVNLAGRATIVTSAIRVRAWMETALTLGALALIIGRGSLAPNVNMAGWARIVTNAIQAFAWMETALTLGAFAMTSGWAPIVTPAFSAGWPSKANVTNAMLAGRAPIVMSAIQECARMDTAARAWMDNALIVGAFAILTGMVTNAIGCMIKDALASMRQMWSISWTLLRSQDPTVTVIIPKTGRIICRSLHISTLPPILSVQLVRSVSHSVRMACMLQLMPRNLVCVEISSWVRKRGIKWRLRAVTLTNTLLTDTVKKGLDQRQVNGLKLWAKCDKIKACGKILNCTYGE
jgi:hypothetical protein